MRTAALLVLVALVGCSGAEPDPAPKQEPVSAPVEIIDPCEEPVSLYRSVALSPDRVASALRRGNDSEDRLLEAALLRAQALAEQHRECFTVQESSDAAAALQLLQA
jgi:hypothetical protein